MHIQPRDLSNEARKFYRMLKLRPAVFLGCESITFLRTYMDGMVTADRLFNGTRNVIIPDGFTEFIEWYYGDDTNLDGYACVLKAEGDEKKALYKWFDLLDDFLKGLDYEPIGTIEQLKKLEEYRKKKRS
ncbi:MAG: hypothetical protein J6I46_04415 [Ruminococcus sp.]|nr:hypothetical protein [Ruminococcus sp.]MBP3797003.1 hypothetical protein [Ruminococcus sp.]MBQ1432454.1 hypothetical protein [Ruminococcus sp.]